MDNPIQKYIEDHQIRVADFARMLKVTDSSVFHWKSNFATPSKKNAWKMHRLTKGRVPLDYWGYAIINGKII